VDIGPELFEDLLTIVDLAKHRWDRQFGLSP
jgi:hypothetical protein